jgi:hypothetical protein
VNFMKKPRIPQDYQQAIAVFDPLEKLPDEARTELAEEIKAACQRYQLSSLNHYLARKLNDQKSPHKISGQMRAIRQSARKLSKALGVPDGLLGGAWLPRMLVPLMVEFAKRRNRQISGFELIQEQEGKPLFDLAMMLEPLAEAAEQVELDQAEQIAQGRPQEPKGALLGNLFDIYDEMRRRYPDSGPKIAFSEGGPLFRFVNAVLVGYGRSPVTDAVIRGALTQWAETRKGCPELSDLD